LGTWITTPLTSGMKMGSEVVPCTRNGMRWPRRWLILAAPPLSALNTSLRTPAVAVAAPMPQPSGVVSVATILQSRWFLASIVPAPVTIRPSFHASFLIEKSFNVDETPSEE